MDFVKKAKFKKEVCLCYNLAPSTLSKLMKNEKLRDEFDKNINTQRSTLKRPRHEDLEASLVKWVTMVRENNIAVTGPLVIEKASEFASLMGISDFHGSQGWLSRFKKRANLNFQVMKFISQ